MKRFNRGVDLGYFGESKTLKKTRPRKVAKANLFRERSAKAYNDRGILDKKSRSIYVHVKTKHIQTTFPAKVPRKMIMPGCFRESKNGGGESIAKGFAKGAYEYKQMVIRS